MQLSCRDDLFGDVRTAFGESCIWGIRGLDVDLPSGGACNKGPTATLFKERRGSGVNIDLIDPQCGAAVRA